MTKVLTDTELAEIRAQLARRDPNVGGGYTWTTIEALLDTVDAYRGLATDINPTSRYEAQENAPTAAAIAYAQSVDERPETDEERVARVIESARRNVAPIISREREGENVGEIMNFRMRSDTE